MNAILFVRNDFRLLWRHGFAVAYLVVAVLYAAVLSALPRRWADAALPVLAWSDTAFFCFFFAGASVCLDMAQGTFQTLFVSPLRPSAYFIVKSANLSVLSFAMAAVVSLSCRGADFRPLPLAAAALLGGAPTAIIGASLAIRLRTVNRFMIGSIPIFLLLALPAVRYAAGRWLPEWFAALSRWAPTEGALSWARAAFAHVSARELVGGVVSAALWTGAATAFLLGPASARARGE
jgi:fluoroquinolone transport system permease protein